MRRRFLTAMIAAIAAGFLPSAASAQSSYPNRPIRLVAPFAPRGGVDIAARIVAEKLQPILGQPIVVENRGGAGAMIGSDMVAKAAPDGYTLLLTSNSLVNSPILFGRAPYDWRKDFAFITTILTQPMALVVHPSVQANTIAEFIALAKRDGAKLSMATSSAGTINHLAGELMMRRIDTRWEVVHYKGAAPANVDLLAGTVQFQFDQVASALPLVRTNRLKPLAVTTLTRSPLLPDVPTLDESGLKGFEAVTLFGLIAPAGTPADVIAKLSAAMEKVLGDPAVIERFNTLGAQARFSTPDGLRDALAKQADTWGPIIREANIKLE